MTIGKCLEHCRKKSAHFAALYTRTPRQCQCNDEMLGEDLKTDEKDCTDSCIGDLENTG